MLEELFTRSWIDNQMLYSTKVIKLAQIWIILNVSFHLKILRQALNQRSGLAKDHVSTDVNGPEKFQSCVKPDNFQATSYTQICRGCRECNPAQDVEDNAGPPPTDLDYFVDKNFYKFFDNEPSDKLTKFINSTT